MSGETDELLGHDYDGIQEYDNPLPRWWLVLFYLSIAFAVVYVPWYHFGPGPLPLEEYAMEMESAGVEVKPGATFDSATLTKAAGDPAQIAAGKAVYDKNCVACHTATGAGLVGPNLTDAFWIHGGSLEEIAKVIADGVPEKGMIAWKTQLSDAEIVSVTAFIRTLRGTNPPNGKAAEGKKYEGD